ncbi:MAG: hypothetical protein KF691_09960 [Phycisphaeraceae bacterium]|nr:hypothetical protein [Phycisphaeraceae bacterium]
MTPVIRETRRFGAGAIAALVSISAFATSEALGSLSDPAISNKINSRISRRVDAINTGNYGAHLPGALVILSPTLSPQLEAATLEPFNPGPAGLGGIAPTNSFDANIVLQRGTADDACRVIYRSDFDSPLQETLRDEWSYGDVQQAKQGRRFLGTIGNGSTTLTVSQAPQNGDYIIQFDVLALGNWRGNTTGNGAPEVFGVRVVDGPTLTETNFATAPGTMQAYPDTVGRSNFEAGYQAVESFSTSDGQTATVYRLTYRFNRTNAAAENGTDDIRIEFFARGLSSKESPEWGLTNVVLALIPDSGSQGGGGGSGTNQYHGEWGNPYVAAYIPNDFGMMPATGSSPKSSSSADRQVPAPGGVVLLSAIGLLGASRRRR